ncbi:hypothetical protein Plhal304r1_c001g0000081 [Plasmopara halstedii]
MRRWNVMFYGDLSYILGYATSRYDIQVVVIERSDGPCRATMVLDFSMAKLTTQSYACDLEPFVPDEIEKRKISGGEMDFERLNSAYEILRGLDEGSPITHLLTVEKLIVKRDGRLVVELSLVSYLRPPTIDELSEWLQHMLTALKHWHGRG